MNKKKKKNSTICKKKYLRCRRPNDRSTTNRKKMEDERTTTTYFFAPKNWYLTNFFPSLFMITFDVKKRKTLPGYLWILSAERFIIIITAYQIYFDEKNRNYAACVRERKVKRIFFYPHLMISFGSKKQSRVGPKTLVSPPFVRCVALLSFSRVQVYEEA